MKTWPIRLIFLVLAAVLLLCFLLPFRSVSIGMNINLSIPGYAMLLGFTFTADGVSIAVPSQIFYIIGAMGALMLLAWAVRSFLRAGKPGGEGFAALAGIFSAVGFLGQSLLEPVAYAANNALPKVVRDLFSNSPEPAATAASIACFLLCIISITYFFVYSSRGAKVFDWLLDRKFKAATIVLAAFALILLATPLKTVDLVGGNRLIVNGFSLLTGITITNGSESATIPPQLFLLGFAFLTVLTVTFTLLRLPKKLHWLKIAVPIMAGLCLFGQILYEMFVYNMDKTLPLFVRQLLSGKYSTGIFLAVGAIFVAALVGTFTSIIEKNKRMNVRFSSYSTLYLFMLPGIILFFVFNYMPMFGVLMAFEKYDPVSGFFKSQWVGMRNFNEIFKLPAFMNALRNTLTIATLRLVIEFPCPIIFALLLNEIKIMKFKRTVQSISYLPNFISWVIVAGIWYQMLSPETGIVNQTLVALGIIKDPVFFMQSKSWFYPVIIFTSMWKNLGFSSILYMAAIAGIDQEQYEAAVVDGAGRFQKMVHITLPGMKNTIVLLFILAVSGLLNAGFDQLWTMGNTAVRDVSDILDTLVLRYLTRGNFKDLSIGAAAGMFKAAVGVVLFFAANLISRKLKQESLI